ncbi:hypothetical protein [Adonisia turfae]|uniref:hypothetical protein n=1 Tax=Adonisia turfae TaxID=2950184 RepID=UPI0013D35C44|nr:hypothetical protein [Adonisia turfae]
MIDAQTINLIKNVTGIDVTTEAATWQQIRDKIPRNGKGLQVERLRALCDQMTNNSSEQ